MRIVLLGAPGSGKKTLTRLLVEKYGIPPVYTGQLQKDAQLRNDKLAEGEERTSPEEMVLDLIRDRLLQPDAHKGFVLEGFPRNIIQAITLDEVLAELGKPVELALLIDLETDALMERLVGRRTCSSCGQLYNIYSHPSAVDDICDLCGGRLRHRADDNEETVSGRLHVYEHFASNLIKHYTRQDKLRRVDGLGEVEEVFARACAIVDAYEPPPPGGLPADDKDMEADQAAEPSTVDQADPAVPAAEEEGPSPAVEKKKAVNKEAAVRKAKVKKQPAAKKSAVKKRAATVKKATKKKATAVSSAKKKASPAKPVAKKKAAKQGGASKKAVHKKKGVKKTIAAKTAAKKGGVKKKAATKRQIAAKKSPIKKVAVKQVSGKKVAAKKSGLKKMPAKKAATAKKKVAVKKKATKKLPVKKVGAGKKQSRARKKTSR